MRGRQSVTETTRVFLPAAKPSSRGHNDVNTDPQASEAQAKMLELKWLIIENICLYCVLKPFYETIFRDPFLRPCSETIAILAQALLSCASDACGSVFTSL